MQEIQIITGILKRINIKNSDTDTYSSITFDIDNNNIDLNKIYQLKHKRLRIAIKEE